MSDRGPPGQELRLPQHGTGRRGRHLDTTGRERSRKEGVNLERVAGEGRSGPMVGWSRAVAQLQDQNLRFEAREVQGNSLPTSASRDPNRWNGWSTSCFRL